LFPLALQFGFMLMHTMRGLKSWQSASVAQIGGSGGVFHSGFGVQRHSRWIVCVQKAGQDDSWQHPVPSGAQKLGFLQSSGAQSGQPGGDP
jgi:hypothetical protein